MVIKKTLVGLLATTAIALTICTTAPKADAFLNDKEDVGTLFGAIVGGLAGNQIGKGSGNLWATGAGVFLGSIIGRGVGQSLDRTDTMYAERSYSHTLETLPSGYTSEWYNPDSGHRGTYTPTNTYRQPSGQYCREFQQTVTIGGRTERAYGTACRQIDGSWQIVQSGGNSQYRGRCLDGDNRCYRRHGIVRDW